MSCPRTFQMVLPAPKREKTYSIAWSKFPGVGAQPLGRGQVTGLARYHTVREVIWWPNNRVAKRVRRLAGVIRAFAAAPVEYGHALFEDRGRPDGLDGETGNEAFEAG